MLQITIPAQEYFNEITERFINSKATVLQLEHSLVSLSKWESKWQKPFLVKTEKTVEESVDYIRCMTLTQNIPDEFYKTIIDNVAVVNSLIEQVSKYIELPMTATTFSKTDKNVINRELITAEVIYYWMITLNIPFECQKWHLNRLLTLINVCNIKNQPQKKMSQKDTLARNRALNEARRNKLHTSG